MALFSYEELERHQGYGFESIETNSYDYKKKYGMLHEATIYEKNSISDYDRFDVFLSHSYQDRKIIHKLKDILEREYRFTVYVDWIEDKLLNRGNVTPETAAVLQKRMKQSEVLIYATSENSSSSKWIPWELGYFDALKQKKIAILPISKNGNTNAGQEYLGLYKKIEKENLLQIVRSL
jgi:hypothetical protein